MWPGGKEHRREGSRLPLVGFEARFSDGDRRERWGIHWSQGLLFWRPLILRRRQSFILQTPEAEASNTQGNSRVLFGYPALNPTRLPEQLVVVSCMSVLGLDMLSFLPLRHLVWLLYV